MPAMCGRTECRYQARNSGPEFVDDFDLPHNIVVEPFQILRWNSPFCVMCATHLLERITAHEICIDLKTRYKP